MSFYTIDPSGDEATVAEVEQLQSQVLPSSTWADEQEKAFLDEIALMVLGFQKLSSTFAKPGTKITILGFNLNNDTQFYFDNEHLDTTDVYGDEISFIVPDKTPGLYKIYLYDPESDYKTALFNFVITSPNTKAPVLTSITPTTGSINTEFLIKGTGFTSTDNIIVRSGSGGVSYNVASNGTTLAFHSKIATTESSTETNSISSSQVDQIIKDYYNYTPADYVRYEAVFVENINGRSNTLLYTIEY